MATKYVEGISNQENRKSLILNPKEMIHVPKRPIICKDKIYLDIYPELNKQIENGETQEIYYFQANKSVSNISIQKIKLDSEKKTTLEKTKKAIKECNEEENSHYISEKSEKDEEEYIIDNEFLATLTNNRSNLNEGKLVNTISKFIRNSKLMQKLEEECDNKEDINNLSYLCAKQLAYTKIHKGEILFRIGEVGDRFYFILNGKISILKPKTFNYDMLFHEYMNYCYFLFKNNENYLLSKVLEDNYESFPILATDDVEKIHDILFKQTICDKITNEEISKNVELIKLFNEFHKKFEDYNLNTKDLETFQTRKIRSYNGINKDWDNYILEKIRPTFNELMFFEPFETIYAEKTKKNINLLKYETFMYMGTGLFFGDFALEKDVGERTATIRAEENTVLASLKLVDYVNTIAPKRRLEKKKEILFLNNNYFLKNINERIFDKNYYHLFTQKEYSKDATLFNPGEKPTKIIFMKTGKISLTVKCSIVDLNTLLVYISDKLINCFSIYENRPKKYITKQVIKQINSYCNDPVLKKMKTLNPKLVEELHKERIFQIALISDVEIIGLEAAFLKISHISKGQIVNDKITCHELAIEQLNNLLNEEKENIYEMYVRISCNKILSLIERIQNLKRNWIDIAKMRSQNDNFYTNKILLSLLKNSSESKNEVDKNECTKCENSNSINTSLNKCTSIENTKFCDLLDEVKKGNKRSAVNSAKKTKSLRNTVDQLYQINVDFTNESNKNLNLSEFKKGKNRSKKNDSILIGNKRVYITDLKKSVLEYCSKKKNQKNFSEDNKYEPRPSNMSLSSYCREFHENSIRIETSPMIKDNTPIKINGINYFENGKNGIINYNSCNSKICKTNNNIITDLSSIKIRENNNAIKLPKLIIKDKNQSPSQNNFPSSCSFRNSYNKKNKKIVPNVEKVKSYYRLIKHKGCIPFINQEKNTFFTRKFHQKYAKELPKIDEN